MSLSKSINHVLPQKLCVVNLNLEVCKIPDINVSEPTRLAAKKVSIIHYNFSDATAHVFSKNTFTRERANPHFLVTFNVIVCNIFPENVIEVPQAFKRYEDYKNTNDVTFNR